VIPILLTLELVNGNYIWKDITLNNHNITKLYGHVAKIFDNCLIISFGMYWDKFNAHCTVDEVMLLIY